MTSTPSPTLTPADLPTRLCAVLRERANHRGLVLTRAPVLQEALRCSFEELYRALAQVSISEPIEILTPLPYLVLAFRPRMLPGMHRETAKTPANASRSLARGYSYSFHNQSIDQSKAIAIEDGGAGEGGTLLQEILETLGERDPAPFRGVLDHHAPERIRTVLKRVRATPPERLKKSRTALFRFLLADRH